jgi:outer membrane protein TolC
MAGDALSGAYGPYVPTLTFDATHKEETEMGEFDARKFNPYFPAQIDTGKIGPELSGKAPFGFSYDFSSFLQGGQAITDFRADPRLATYFPGGVRTTNDYTASAALTMRQHLLKDFWIDSDREVLLARRADLKISQQALRFQIMKILLAVELAYDDLLAAREEIRVQEKALELRQQFVKETERRVQVGDQPPLDSAQAEAQLQNTLTALAAAREAFALRQNSLIGLMSDNFKEWADVEVQPTDTLLALPVTVDRWGSFECALTNRPDLIEARLAVQKTGVMVKFRFNQLFPNLDLVGGYGGLGTETVPRTALDDAFSFRNPEYSYGVVVSFPLDNLSAKADYRSSAAAKKIAQLQLEKAEQDVLLQVSNFGRSVEYRFRQVASTQKARTYAEAALDAETKKLQNGFTTSFVVLQFQEILTAARMAEVRALVDYNQLLAQLAFAEGTILEQHHVSLEVK